jgi:hypothetical protein
MSTYFHGHIPIKITFMKVKLFGIGGKNLTNKLPSPQANCLQILVESPSILSAGPAY